MARENIDFRLREMRATKSKGCGGWSKRWDPRVMTKALHGGQVLHADLLGERGAPRTRSPTKPYPARVRFGGGSGSLVPLAFHSSPALDAANCLLQDAANSLFHSSPALDKTQQIPLAALDARKTIGIFFPWSIS